MPQIPPSHAHAPTDGSLSDDDLDLVSGGTAGVGGTQDVATGGEVILDAGGTTGQAAGKRQHGSFVVRKEI